MAGILVGIGTIINTTIDNKYIGAMLFSFALLAILQSKLFLYTGSIGTIKNIKDFPLFLKILFFNLFGVSLPTSIMMICNEEFHDSAMQISQNKFTSSMSQSFVYAFLCGILMFVAVQCKDKTITIFCIMIFILSGYKHCIADFPYFLFNFEAMNLIKFIFIILGNSFGSIIANKLINTEEELNIGV